MTRRTGWLLLTGSCLLGGWLAIAWRIQHRQATIPAHAGILLARLAPATCSGPTDLTIVAHQDDDLLFMNPDISNAIAGGHCSRTIYVTAGDAGQSKNYWTQRERGAEAAYDAMMSRPGLGWTSQSVRLSSHAVVQIASPRGNRNISLIFMRLPDGNTDGSGFPATGHQSLAHLAAGKVATARAVDGSSSYNFMQLTEALRQLMAYYQPTEIRTQAAQADGPTDHSDHLAVGRLVLQAYAGHQTQSRPVLKSYLGYEIQARPVNLSSAEAAQKQAAFRAYAKFDSIICRSAAVCLTLPPPYSSFVLRQYQAEP